MSYVNSFRNALNAPTVQKDLAKASTHLEHLGDATTRTASSVGNIAGNIVKSTFSVLESVGMGYLANKTIAGEVIGILPAAAGISWFGWGYTASAASLTTKIITPVTSLFVFHPLVTLAGATTFCFFKYTNGFENVKNTVNSVSELGVDAFNVAAATYNICSSTVSTAQEIAKVAFLNHCLGHSSNSEDVVNEDSATTVNAGVDTIPNLDSECDSAGWVELSMSDANIDDFNNQVAEMSLTGIVAAA